MGLFISLRNSVWLLLSAVVITCCVADFFIFLSGKKNTDAGSLILWNYLSAAQGELRRENQNIVPGGEVIL